MDLFSLTQGEALPLVATLSDDQGNPIVTYAGTEALSAVLWPGGSLPIAGYPAVAWISAGAGTIALSLSAVQSAALAEGRYFGLVTLADPTLGLIEAYRFTVDVKLAPGLTTTGLCYAGFADMIKYARNWLRLLQDDDSTSGFVQECADASRWLDDLIIARYPTMNFSMLGDSGYGALAWGVNPGALPNQWLRGVLAGGGLILRPKVVKVVAQRALSIVAKGQIGVDSSKTDYRYLAKLNESESAADAATLVAEICTDGTGVPSFGVSLGGTSMRPMFG